MRGDGDGHGVIGSAFSSRRVGFILILFLIVLLGVFLASASFRTAVAAGYPNDSLFTLSAAKAAGVVAIALTLLLGFFWVLSVGLVSVAPSFAGSIIRKALGVSLATGLGWTAFAVAFTLSPQVFYTYYRTIISGLPNQVVVRPSAVPERLMKALSFADSGALSAHLTGIALYAVPVFCLAILGLKWGPDDQATSSFHIGVATGVFVLIASSFRAIGLVDG